MPQTQTWKGEEISVVFLAHFEKADYGVPHLSHLVGNDKPDDRVRIYFWG